MRYTLAGIYYIITVSALAQVTGQVKDFKTGLYVAGAEVFLADGITVSVTDSRGFFTLEGIPKGQFAIGCTKEGYTTIFQKVTVTEKESTLLFILKKEKGKKVNDQQLMADITTRILGKSVVFNEWNREIQVLKRDFRIFETETGQTKISGELEFKNVLLGYSGTAYLSDFNSTDESTFVKFKPLEANSEQQKIWDDNRFSASKLRLSNFLESVLQGTTELNGYSTVNQGNQVFSLEALLHTGFTGQINFIKLDKPIKVTQQFNGKSYESRIQPFSRIAFDDHGVLLNSDSVQIQGAMVQLDLGLKLPIEYTPSADRKTFKLDQYFEKPYLHTDRNYYYPGDTVWFKAYMNYKTLSLIESLSKVLHVELLDSYNGGRILQTKLLKIDDGEAWGEFVLPDSLPVNYVALRAYTNWQRNFGDNQVFVKYLPFLKGNINIETTRSDLVVNHRVKVRLNKKSYMKRERILMDINVLDEQNKPISSWMSVSVTDLSMNSLIKDSISITTSLPIKPFTSSSQIKFSLERGLEINGRYLDILKKPMQVNLTVVGAGLGSYKFDTDLNGGFGMSGLNFFDSIQVNFTAANKKKILTGGSIELERYDPLPLSDLVWPKPVEDIVTGDYKIDKRSTTLKDVVIRAKRQRIISEDQKAEEAIKRSRPFGEPDHILDEKNLNYNLPNVIEMMRGKIPGLIISYDGNTYQIKSARSGSFTLNTDPIVVIDDVQSGGQAVPTLLSINSANVVSIEVILRLTALAGSTGGNGIISIYTKGGGLRGKFIEEESTHKVKVGGYSKPLSFRGYDHSDNFLPLNSDFRPTLYWNPSVISSTKYGNQTLSFYASDSTGPYLISIEGVTEQGKPFKHEQTISVDQ